MSPDGASCPFETDMCNRIQDTVGRSVCSDHGAVRGAYTIVSQPSFTMTSFSSKGSAYITSDLDLNPALQNEHKWGRDTLALLDGLTLTWTVAPSDAND